MPEFGSVHKPSQKDVVHLTNPNSSYNISWADAEKLVSYLKGLKVELTNLRAISSQGQEYEKKWVMENGWTMDDPLYILGDSIVAFNDGSTTITTNVAGHTLGVLAANISVNPRWNVERLLEDHGIVGKDLAVFYMGFIPVQETVNKLF